MAELFRWELLIPEAIILAIAFRELWSLQQDRKRRDAERDTEQ